MTWTCVSLQAETLAVVFVDPFTIIMSHQALGLCLAEVMREEPLKVAITMKLISVLKREVLIS
jgi:hypothetical protein